MPPQASGCTGRIAVQGRGVKGGWVASAWRPGVARGVVAWRGLRQQRSKERGPPYGGGGPLNVRRFGSAG